MKKITLVFIALSFLGLQHTSAQRLKQQPKINEDGSVTFQIRASKAESVILKGSFIPKEKSFRTPAGVFGKDGAIEMKSEKHAWTYTTEPLASEIYTYYYEIDGKRTTDPMNPDSLRDVNQYLSYFIIKGGIADDYVSQNVPHGKVEKVWYASSIKDMPRRRMLIYTPPGYESDAANTYPVLYLLHGSGGDETSWTEIGHLAQIMDNMIASKRCVPMIVVMPNGIADQEAAPGENPYSDEAATATNVESMFGVIEGAFVPDIVKGYVEKNYRVTPDKAHRAIAGLSLGGLHTIFISVNNPDMFDYVGLFSAQTTNALDEKKITKAQKVAQKLGQLYDLAPVLAKGKVGSILSDVASTVNGGHLAVYDSLDIKLKEQFKTPPQLYYIAVGKDDFVKKLNDDFRLKLADAGYRYEYHETDGGHTWENWRKYLVDFLPRIFNK